MKTLTIHSDPRAWFRRARTSLAGALLLCATLMIQPARAGVLLDCAEADVNDDGIVNILDFSLLVSKIGLFAGQEGYLDGLDLSCDGAIDVQDLIAMFPCFGQSAPVSDTVLCGRVFDGIGNPLAGVTVEVEILPLSLTGVTDENGLYAIPIPDDATGAQLITFNGSTAIDPTPGFLSGQYPTIPHKPIFINGGLKNNFREISLPERDLTGAVFLDSSNAEIVENADGTTTATLLTDIQYRNAGVSMDLPAGCDVVFPPGEDPVLSITRVDPAMLPVPMPPGLSSSIFVTYQPGGTVVNCSAGGCVRTEFDNSDFFANAVLPTATDPKIVFADPVPGDQPFLNGIQNGVFAPLAFCVVVDASGVPIPPTEPVLLDDTDPTSINPIYIGSRFVADVPVPFEFAWYHPDAPVLPCPRTIVSGRVKDADGNGLPGVPVSVSGVATAMTDAAGNFSILNVPAGPNGVRCTTNPFSIRVSAFTAGLSGVSAFTPAVPGGVTDVGDICVGGEGTVQGRLQMLLSISPFDFIPLPGVTVQLNCVGADPGTPAMTTTTGANGNYFFPGVPTGAYTVEVLPPLLLGDPPFFGPLFKPGEILGAGEQDICDFRFTAVGKIDLEVLNPDGTPVDFGFADLRMPLELSGGFPSGGPFFAFQEVELGQAQFLNVPLGPFDIEVFSFSEIPFFGGGILNSQGQCVPVLVQPELAPCDISMVDVGTARCTISDGSLIDVLEIIVQFCEPLPNPDFFPIQFKICIDNDQDDSTGGFCNSEDLCEGGTLADGVEWALSCSNFLGDACVLTSFDEFGAETSTVTSADAECLAAFPYRDSSGLDPTRFVILVPMDLLPGLATPEVTVETLCGDPFGSSESGFDFGPDGFFPSRDQAGPEVVDPLFGGTILDPCGDLDPLCFFFGSEF